MGMTTAFATFIAQSVLGEAVTAYNNANAYTGVGDSTTAFANSQTNLQAATNKFRKAMDATFPQRSGAAMTFQSTYASGEANFAWQEWGVFNNASTGTMMCRKVESLGTKATGSWQLTLTVTPGVP